MAEKEKEVKKQENKAEKDTVEYDFSMFIGEEGANILSTEQLKELQKKLPDWSILPPSKYSN